jgi:hypothetical protein
VAGCVVILRSSRWLQFIVSMSGGREFERRRAAVGEGREHWRKCLVVFTVALPLAIIESPNVTNRDMVKCLDTRRTTVIDQRRRGLIPIHR